MFVKKLEHRFCISKPHKNHLYDTSMTPTVLCTPGWSDFSFMWNFEKKQVGVVTFGKKTCLHKKKKF